MISNNMDNQFSDQEINNNNILYPKETMHPVKKRRKFKVLPNKAQLDHKFCRIACQTFTIRGIGKLNRGPQFLRILWLFFIIIMALGLIIASILVILEYLQYDVNINIIVKENQSDPFPSLTICHQHPFSKKAYDLWNKRAVMSPTKFSSILYKTINKHLSYPEMNVDLAESAFQSDMISIYYQNIAQDEAKRIGFSSDIFLNCMYDGGNEVVFEEKCSELSAFHIKTLSHHTFFNCHTFEPKFKDDSTNIRQLGLIVGLGPKPDYQTNEQGLLLDIFNMAKGLRVIVHTAGTFPNIEEESVNVEPGKLNEINFQHVEWENLDTPTNNCVHDDETRFEEDEENLSNLEKEDNTLLYAYKDLGESYTYTERKCNQYFAQLEIIKKCSCQYIYMPRIKSPDKVPYCGNIGMNGAEFANMSKLTEATECLQTVDIDAKYKQCRRLCNKSEYEWSTSITKWRAVDWQLHWLIHLNSAFKDMRKASKHGEFNQSDGHRKWKEFYEVKNLTDIPSKKVKDLNLQGDNFAYVILKRKQGGKVVKKEKLTLSIYVLLSRIGGLCSLSIGLTTAFFIEIIEFVYMIYYQKRQNKKQQHPRETQNDQELLAINPEERFVL